MVSIYSPLKNLEYGNKSVAQKINYLHLMEVVVFYKKFILEIKTSDFSRNTQL